MVRIDYMFDPPLYDFRSVVLMQDSLKDTSSLTKAVILGQTPANNGMYHMSVNFFFKPNLLIKHWHKFKIFYRNVPHNAIHILLNGFITLKKDFKIMSARAENREENKSF